MSWKVYFDESICNRKFVLAGVIFNDQTNAECDAVANWNKLLPLIPSDRGEVFKASEIMRSEAQVDLFVSFYHAFESADCFTCALSFNLEDHKTAVEAIKWPMSHIKHAKKFKRLIRNPYSFAFQRSLAGIVVMGEQLGVTGPLTPVFDDRTEAKKLLENWNALEGWYSSYDSGFSCSLPEFASDNDYPALQMADMLAWLIRKWELKNDDSWTRGADPVLDPLPIGSKLHPGVVHRLEKAEIHAEYQTLYDRIMEELQ
ncbi:DUF3800 domain-containing protein (plasmid) [Ruegeria sp. SCSIO 43209]|uniref:DUF3800 domain-containing protein n=1 Tax=Ruegeria sp. SCSIO 43209 TaxID=2793010 RepID=UPI001CA9D081|nr:DUF3800 domain-containing protein [Ruegeria sp. SCSIO 43209]UAB91542.1 DUF3800 domain-containing protein [Ruegeria sp. SCSIO 43209]